MRLYTFFFLCVRLFDTLANVLMLLLNLSWQIKNRAFFSGVHAILYIDIGLFQHIKHNASCSGNTHDKWVVHKQMKIGSIPCITIMTIAHTKLKIA